MSKLSSSSSSWWRRDEKDANSTLQDLLNQLQNSANIIGNDSTCRVSVRWSNGANVNGSKEPDGTHRIYLSPDNLVSDDEVSEEVLDAMTGKVYLASTLRETVHQQSYNAAANYRRFPAPETKNSVSLWESLETSIARSKILEDWAGFAPYVAGDAKRSSSSKDDTQNFIDSSIVSPNLDAVTTAISWNLLNPKDQVEIPACYDECVKVASEMMEQEVSADKRFESCANIVSKMNEILKQMEEEQEQNQDQDQESKGSGGEGGEGDSDDDRDEESKPKPSEEKGESGEDSPSKGKKKKGKPSKPSLCDSSLLGEAVKNKTDSELSKQEAEDASKSEEDKSEIRAKAPEGMCDLGKKHRVRQESCEGMEEDYKEIVSSHRKEIAAIRSSLMFRKTQPKMVSYGHRSGDIDENSLFKIRMNDDRVMTKTDSVDTKKIAICLLIDESGSMGHHEGGKSYADQARDVAIVLAESLRGMDGIEVCIYGHTAEDGFRGVTLREYYSPRQKNLATLMKVSPRMENHDSYAILHTANLFNRDYRECDRKIMFVVSDGEPAGSGYGGGPAYKHMLEVNRACMGKGVEVYGVGIANAFSKELGEKMYGENKCVILSDVRSSLGVMSRFIRQIAIKQGVR
jgi:hypothetical protein